MRILVTGGCGFIGANLVRKLTAWGAEVSILDNLSTGRASDVEGIGVELVVGDVTDPQAVRQAMAGTDVVVHLAAHTRVVDSIAAPWHDFEVNARGTLTCLQAALEARIERFIFSSTGGAILGDTAPPVHEEMAPRPLSPYGASKLAAEGYCSAFWGSYGLKTVALRFSNVYGPYSYSKASAIAVFMKQILKGEPLTIYGDGSQTRDFLFVEDLCDSVVAACERSLSWGRSYQIGSGSETSLLSLIELLRITVGQRSLLTITEPPRKGEVYRTFTCIDRARKELGFQPRTSLQDGLARTWNWFVQAASGIDGKAF